VTAGGIRLPWPWPRLTLTMTAILLPQRSLPVPVWLEVTAKMVNIIFRNMECLWLTLVPSKNIRWNKLCNLYWCLWLRKGHWPKLFKVSYFVWYNKWQFDILICTLDSNLSKTGWEKKYADIRNRTSDYCSQKRQFSPCQKWKSIFTKEKG